MIFFENPFAYTFLLLLELYYVASLQSYFWCAPLVRVPYYFTQHLYQKLLFS